MSSFYNIPNTEKAEIFRNAGEQKNMPAFAIEKDWWVVQCIMHTKIGTSRKIPTQKPELVLNYHHTCSLSS